MEVSDIVSKEILEKDIIINQKELFGFYLAKLYDAVSNGKNVEMAKEYLEIHTEESIRIVVEYLRRNYHQGS